MDDLELFLKWIGTDQDEELNDVVGRYTNLDPDTPDEDNWKIDPDPGDEPTDEELLWWESVRMYPSTGLFTLDDYNMLRRILLRCTGRGTGYGVRLYSYPDYFSGLSIWVPDAWAVEPFLSRLLWEGEEVLVWNENAGEPRPFEGLFDQIANLGKAYRNKNSMWREVILNLQYWNMNAGTYVLEKLINFLPWFNVVDEIAELPANMPYPVWENISFENTTPNLVIDANWYKCKNTVDRFFKLGQYQVHTEDPEEEGWNPHLVNPLPGGSQSSSQEDRSKYDFLEFI